LSDVVTFVNALFFSHNIRHAVGKINYTLLNCILYREFNLIHSEVEVLFTCYFSSFLFWTAR